MLESPGGEHVTMVSTNRDEVSQLIRAATMRKPAAVPAEGMVESPNEALLRENQELKDLIVELSLENRDQVFQFLILSKRSEEHTSELQSHSDLVCRLL